MHQRIPLLFYFLLALFVLSGCTKEENEPPNIIIIMGDDMGFSDIGAYGGEINTPNLNLLAANGLRYTQFYNTARCCPTRASLLTGLYPQQAGVGHMLEDRGTPGYQGDLSKEAVTIAEVLKEAGYTTYMSGKWHITPYMVDNPDKSNWPRQRGFDKFFGMISGAGSFYDPRSLTEENQYVAPGDDFYATNNFTNKAVHYILEHDSEKPYFLYVAYTAAHWPLQAPANEVSKYKGYYDHGWDELRQQRYQRLKQMGIVDEDWSLTPRDSLVMEWSEDVPDRNWEIANMEVYAAMIDIMDQGIGQIVEALKTTGEFDNTLILFLQDNGACAEELDWVRPQPEPTNLPPLPPDQPQTKMIPYVTRDGKPVKIMKDAWPGPPESYTAYGRNWANASNTPFREYKHWVHEGGISTPLIAHWPERIKSGGAFRDVPSHLIDIMATCVDVASATYPSSYQGHNITPLEGKSLVPTFYGNQLEQRAIFWEHEGNRAVRKGKWKLISKADRANSSNWDKIEELPMDYWELFDMQQDRTELNNVAADHPEIVKDMSRLWMKWARRAGAMPRPNI